MLTNEKILARSVVSFNREQLNRCREKIEQLEKSLEDVQEQIEEEDAKGNR